jgi:flagellar motor switch protein FliM
MSQVLSQNEVDALLSAVSEGDFEEEKAPEENAGQEASAAESAEVRSYDLTSQERIFRGKMPMLDVIHERYGRDFGSTLSLDLGRLSEAEPTGTRLLNYQEFLNGLAVPSCLSVFKIDPLPGSGVIVVDTQFVFTLVDVFCGGRGGSSLFRVEGRDFSSIELGFVRRIVKKALQELMNAWRPVYPVDVSFVRTEINPQFVSIAHPTEVVVIMESVVDVEGASGKMQIVIPYATLEPIKDRLGKGYIGERGELDKVWREELQQHILDSEVELKSIMGHAHMSIREIVDLKVGDVVQLERFANQPLDVKVAGVEKYKAESGVIRSYKALQLTKRIIE